VSSTHNWFAILVKPRHEKAVSAALRGKGYKEYLPLYKSQRKSAGHVRTADLPLFPMYVFCRFDPTQRLPILTIPGVFSIVGTSTAPTPLDDHEIEGIQTLVGSGMRIDPWPCVEIGEVVQITQGPLSGLSGVLLSAKGADRLIVTVTLLRRSISVEIDRQWAEPLHRPGTSSRRGAARSSTSSLQ
jgi:transcription antitermination factor NusG